jgi:cell wall-associated NlpC family hydrolase
MLTVQHQRCQNQNTPARRECKDKDFLFNFATMRKSLIIPVLLLSMLSCASVRRATPIAAEDLKTYPVGQADEKKPAVSQKKEEASAQAEKVPAQNSAAKQKPTSKSKQPLSQQVIEYARTFTGIPYKLGAAGPKQFDCSHFTAHVFKKFGYTLTPFTQAQFREGREVPSYADMQVGDLVFFGKRGSVRDIGHVGIVVSLNRDNGSFNFIHASTSKGVTEDNSNQAYYLMRYVGARRILPDE